MTSRPAGPVVFDLEFTAWPGSIQSQWSRPGEFREVVQIGAVRLSPRTLKPVEEFEMLIIPRLNPVLSDFFVQLTGITNEALTRRGCPPGRAGYRQNGGHRRAARQRNR